MEKKRVARVSGRATTRTCAQSERKNRVEHSRLVGDNDSRCVGDECDCIVPTLRVTLAIRYVTVLKHRCVEVVFVLVVAATAAHGLLVGASHSRDLRVVRTAVVVGR